MIFMHNKNMHTNAHEMHQWGLTTTYNVTLLLFPQIWILDYKNYAQYQVNIIVYYSTNSATMINWTKLCLDIKSTSSLIVYQNVRPENKRHVPFFSAVSGRSTLRLMVKLKIRTYINNMLHNHQFWVLTFKT